MPASAWLDDLQTSWVLITGTGAGLALALGLLTQRRYLSKATLEDAQEDEAPDNEAAQENEAAPGDEAAQETQEKSTESGKEADTGSAARGEEEAG
ncbi:hypothetical protein B0T19DRAFT_441020 [Cercophora scortea]|uniref:Uncharacterized protein n=1 Tax=Cercophora scortea TaxID=314031 RepID=A0AAE0IL97_9PEZI|nr:hypothetical protein B0T19DRAFT_441020 [Cercophora scortea]